MGCAILARGKAAQRTEEEKALRLIANGMVKKDLTDEESRRLSQQIQKDPRAQSAVSAITNSMGGTAAPAKYCPVDGTRFSSRLKICPEHHVELKSVDE